MGKEAFEHSAPKGGKSKGSEHKNRIAPAGRGFKPRGRDKKRNLSSHREVAAAAPDAHSLTHSLTTPCGLSNSEEGEGGESKKWLMYGVGFAGL